VLLAILLGALALYAAAPTVQNLVDSAVQQVVNGAKQLTGQKYVPVRPARVSSDAALPDHPATAATDGLTNTFWAALDPGGHPTLTLAFDGPVDLDRAIVHAGGTNAVQAWSRPQQLRLTYSTGTSEVVDLQDTLDPQQVPLHRGHGVTEVTLEVLAVHPSPENPRVALSEIEFFDLRTPDAVP
jgi:hypothetical protein